MRRPRAWALDLALGVRLAVVGSRDAWARLVLTAVGVGLGAAVLLLAAAMPGADARSDARVQARAAVGQPPPDGAGAILRADGLGLSFRGENFLGYLLDPLVADPALPPGVDRLPGDGEMVVSPALARLLASPDGALLRPRLPWTQVGIVGDAGLAHPRELVVYAGGFVEDGPDGQQVYGWGSDQPSPMRTEVLMLALSGSVVVLVPVLVLVAAATRVAAAARERRLAALRLIGADAGQTRRLASGEALVGAVGGVLLGLVFFQLGREFAAGVSLLGLSMFASDLMPSPLTFVLIMLAVPALAVLTAVLSLRRIVAQPLGLARQSTPPRRRLWWRLVPLVVGVTLLATQAGAFARVPTRTETVFVLTGLGLAALAVPVLLPWLLQRAVGPLSGGPPSWQLAVRRLQLDSGTPARAAGGLAAVLTAAVAFQTMLASSFAEDVDWDKRRVGDLEGRIVQVYGAEPRERTALEGLADLLGVLNVRTYHELSATTPDEAYTVVRVASCEVLHTYLHITDCATGDAFQVPSPGDPNPVDAGDELRFFVRQGGTDAITGPWTVPPDLQRVQPRGAGSIDVPSGTILVPEGTVPDSLIGDVRMEADVLIDAGMPDVAELVANALVPLGRDVRSYAFTVDDEAVVQLRNTLLMGALVVLLLAAASLLIVSIEQIRERRRQLATLAASGVGGRTLAASVLWQATVPFGVATVASLGVGTGLGWLLMRVFATPAIIDWTGMATITAAALVAVLVVTALSLPSLRHATHPEALRME